MKIIVRVFNKGYFTVKNHRYIEQKQVEYILSHKIPFS